MFKQYNRIQLAEIREVTDTEIMSRQLGDRISLSPADMENGSPKKGDVVARNPKNHDDQWLIAEQYFLDNFVMIDCILSEETK